MNPTTALPCLGNYYLNFYAQKGQRTESSLSFLSLVEISGIEPLTS